MALMPTFWGLSDMMCGLCGSEGCLGGGSRRRGRVREQLFLVQMRCASEGLREQCQQGGVGIKEEGEVSPGSRGC